MTSLAWSNLIHRKARTCAALTGVAMAVLLMFLQFGFYQAAHRSSVMMFNQFSHDVVLVSSQYVFFGVTGTIDRRYVYQSLAIEGVERAAPLYSALARWRNPSTGVQRELVVFGLRSDDRPFRQKAINDLLPVTAELDTALLDQKRGFGYEDFRVGVTSEIDGHRVKVVGAYTNGVGFSGNAGLVVSDVTFSRVFEDFRLQRTNVGLLWLEPGIDTQKVIAGLKASLPPDVRVMTRSEHFANEQDFIMNQKPLGIIFSTGIWLAFVVGGVILYQILSAEVVNHLSEYATLKAIGYGTARVYGVVWWQAVLFAFLGYLPALVAAFGVYHIIDTNTNLPTRMTLETLLTVLALSAFMCSISGFLAVRKVDRADPADLF